MYRKAKQILLVILISLLTGAAGYLIGKRNIRETETVVQVDTLIVYDTIRIENPTEIRYVRTKEIVKIPVHDTVRIHDTTFMLLRKEVREYRDSMYYAKVSGYEPSLDYIEVYPKTVTISKTETIVPSPSPWRYHVAIGVDYRRMERQYILPNIGAGVSFRKFSFDVECGVQTHIPDGEYLPPQLYFGGGIKYRLAGN